MKVLMIDDNEMLTDLWKRIFAGCPEVVVARCLNTEEAVAAIGKEHPGAIFLDHNLEDGGVGLEIARQLTAQTKPPRIFSTSPEAETGKLREQYDSIGVEWVGKRPDVLAKKIIELIHKK